MFFELRVFYRDVIIFISTTQSTLCSDWQHQQRHGIQYVEQSLTSTHAASLLLLLPQN